MTRITIAVAFAFLLASVALNFFFGFYLGSNSEIANLSSSTAWQLAIISLSLVVEFGIALILFVFILPIEKLPQLANIKPAVTATLGRYKK